ncbi:hypothetical protein [uncultured Shewanella sp.]|uniref:hypothetical protein n=1 Tax=uncultured Shewanella sp. TaxID=173975 RepID=UPI0026190A6A|nr:hypothetical protein [uncultured Shewanella sp.]
MISSIKLILFGLFLVFYLPYSFAQNHSLISQSHVAINQCISKFQSETKNKISEDIDHVYVDVFSKGMVIGFTRGEVGIFDERSINYKPYLVCGLYEKTIVYLGDGLRKEPIFDNEFNDKYHDYKHDFISLLFKKNADDFEFSNSMKIKVD